MYLKFNVSRIKVMDFMPKISIVLISEKEPPFFAIA
jgi:hypothetical protein